MINLNEQEISLFYKNRGRILKQIFPNVEIIYYSMNSSSILEDSWNITILLQEDTLEIQLGKNIQHLITSPLLKPLNRKSTYNMSVRYSEIIRYLQKVLDHLNEGYENSIILEKYAILYDIPFALLYDIPLNFKHKPPYSFLDTENSIISYTLLTLLDDIILEELSKIYRRLSWQEYLKED